MRNRGSIFRLITSCVICLAIISYSFYSFLFTNNGDKISAADSNIGDFSTLENEDNDEENSISSESHAESSNSTASDNQASQDSQSIAAGSNGTALGKIVSRYISPYSAGTSFNNTYLKNSTDLNIDIQSFLSSALSFKIEKSDQPQVLIMHTHTTESFMTEDRDYYTDTDLSRTLDENYNVVHLGNIVTDKLNAAGIKTIHSATTHDYPEYNGSYSRAADTICSYLDKYPSIKVVIDMHRDAISSGDSDKVKPVTEIDGKKAAQVMIVMGSQSGGVTNFPDWQENLKLALRLQQSIEVMYPTLARPLSLMSRNYNESLTKGSMLIEFGTEANTIDEVSYSAEMVGNALVGLFNTLE